MRTRWVWMVLVAAACGGGSDDPGVDGPGGTPDGPVVDAPPACVAPTGPGVEHQGAIGSDETWTAADSPHIVVAPVAVASATLTIERCAVVQLDGGIGIDVIGTPGSEGHLVAREA